MKIKFIRMGFANNSSSSHSIIFTKNINQLNSDPGEFGWDYFTCADSYSKQKYLFATLAANIRHSTTNIQYDIDRKYNAEYGANPTGYKTDKFVLDVGFVPDSPRYFKKVFDRIVKSLGLHLAFPNYEDLMNDAISDEWFNYPDHQSQIFFPKDVNGKIHMGFANDFIKYLLENNFAILGGNDNDGKTHKYSNLNEGHELIAFVRQITDTDSAQVVYDGQNQDYIIQNKESGHIYRVSFSNDLETKKSSIPTLVDICVTSYCNFGCKFCYQSSTKDGVHADLENIKHTLKELRNAGTLEVVFGGGEPTEHPNFLEILKYSKELGFVVGFTTKNYKLKNIKELSEYCHTIAFSCNTVSDVDKVRTLLEKNYIRSKVYIQNILGLHSLDQLAEFLEECKKSYLTQKVNLLGYKEFGFGNNQSSKNVEGWIQLAKTHSNKLQIGIDSIVVKKYKDELISAGVDYRTLVGEEGKFSCYIDCVKNTISASSFTNDRFDFDSNWLVTYKSF